MIRNPYLWSVFRLILSLKSSKLRIFSLKPLIFKLKYIGFQERNRDITIITHAFRTFKPCKKTLGTKIDSCILFLGFEYFTADYFSDLSILPRFISRIWVFSLYLRLLFKQLRWRHKACHHTTSLCIIPIEKPLIKQVIVLVKKNPLQPLESQGIHIIHLSICTLRIYWRLEVGN